MCEEAEKRLPYRTDLNYLKNLSDYEALCRKTGFANIKIIDATEECWHGCFWNQVHTAHSQLLARKIDISSLNTYLNNAYRMVDDIEYYILAAVGKGHQ